jgi:hypothetical protein
MKIDLTYAKLPWHQAMSKIIDRHRLDLEPCLIVRADNPEKTNALNDYVNSIPNSFQVRLGKSSSLAYFDVELLSQIEGNKTTYRREIIPHQKILFRICAKLKQMPGNPIVICDRSNYLNSRALFRILQMINALEGKVLFMFLISEEYADQWICKRGGALEYFLKIVDHKYAMYE